MVGEKTVKVYVHGGVVQNVDVPIGVVVEIYDYDVDEEDNEHVQKDDEGCRYVKSTWGQTKEDR